MHILPVFFLALILSFSLAHPQQTLLPRVLQTQGNTTLPSSSQVINDELTFYFEYSDNSVTIALVFNIPNQYFAVGLGTNMDQADIWGFTINGSQIQAEDYWSVAEGTPSTDVILGGVNNVELLAYDIGATSTMVKFNRLLVTGDEYDWAIATGTEVDVIWMYAPTAGISYHGKNAGSVTVDLSNGQNGNAGIDESYTEFIHGLIMITSWGLLFDFSLYWVRGAKGKKRHPSFQLIHSSVMFLIILFTCYAIYQINPSSNSFGISGLQDEFVWRFHHFLGWFAFFGSFLQIFVGSAILYISKSHKHQAALFPTRKIHGILGDSIYISTRGSLFIGSLLGGTPWMASIIPYLCISVGFQIFLMIRARNKDKAYTGVSYKPSFSLTENQRKLIEQINKGESREKLVAEFPNMRWVFFGNYIVDLTDWIHPGGNFIIKALICREVTPFLNGAYTIEELYEVLPPRSHSRQAFELIQNSMIGFLKNFDSVLMKRGVQDDKESPFGTNWTLRQKVNVTKTVARCDFTSDKFYVKTFVGGHMGLGRHFSIKFKNKKGHMRTYTTVMAMTEDNIKLRECLFNAFENNTKPVIPKDLIQPRTSLPLFIKKYNFPGGLSKAIHEADLNYTDDKEFLIEGPFGRGLELHQESKGQYTIVCSGTGIFPFADFLQYLLIKAIYDMYKQKNMNDEANMILDLGFDFHMSFRDVSVKLIAAFDGQDEIYCEDLIRNLAFISKKYNLNLFEAVISDGAPSDNVTIEKKRFDAGFLKQHVSLNSKAVWVCGPPAFNKVVPEELVEVGINQQRIIFV